MKKILLVAMFIVTIFSNAQVGIGTNNPASSSILDISSTNKGFLLPRMTNSQKNSIATPTAGLWIWCSDCGASGEMQVYNGTSWTTLSDDVAPSSLAYTGSPFIFTKGTTISPIATPTYLGGTVSYTISPSLPSGLVFNSVTGAITGTPTAIQSATTHTITATNASGSTYATISITVNDIAPSALAYAGSPFSFTKGTNVASISSAVPTNAGGQVVSFLISPSLPSGLSFNTATGAITGTPTALQSATTYTITATNSGGSTTTSISISVGEFLDNLNTNYAFSLRKLRSSYSGSAIRVRRSSDNTEQDFGFDASGNLNETALLAFVGSNDGFVTTWYDQSGNGNHAIAPGTVNQPQIVISGVVYKQNNRPAIKSIFVLNSTNSSRLQFIPTAAITTNQFSLVGQSISVGNFSLFLQQAGPSAYLRLNPSDNFEAWTGGTNVITSSTSQASSALNVYSVLFSTGTLFANGSTIGSATVGTPSSTTGAIALFNGPGGTLPLNGSISELIAFSSTVSRAVLETNQAAYYSINIPPSNLVYTGSPYTYSSITGISAPTNSGGTPTSYSISPVLPSGLSFNTSTGAITGTQTVLSSATTYTVTATNAAGSTTATISITVSAIPPSAMSYSASSFAFTRNTAITPIASPTNSGGTPTSYSISPALPAGLVLNTSSGAITGTPTVGSFATTYTVTANNTGGSTTTTLSITVNDLAPSNLTYTGSPFTYTNGTPIMTVSSPTNTGGTVESYSVSPALPTGLVLNTVTGAIIGTPTAIQSATTYTITATNTGGSTTTTLSITVNDVAPSNLTYTGSPFTYTNGTPITAIASPTNTGGTVASYSVSPALPSGLVFNTTTGAITGTPTVSSAATNYTITATNTGGSTPATISISVGEFLDNLNTNYAFSLRKLRSSYSGSAIRVRRSSDNTEQDFGFDASGNLNETALLAFVGSNDGFVTTWYDQSGNGNHAIAPGTVNQPQIVISGVVYKQNNRPAIKSIFVLNSTNSSRLQFSPVSPIITNRFSLVGQSVSAGNFSLFLQQSGPSAYLRLNPSDNFEAFTAGVPVITSTSSQASSNLKLYTAEFSTGTLFADGTTIGSSSIATPSQTSSTIALFNGPGGTLPLNGSISELIAFSSTVSRAVLESNQTAYYSINVLPSNLVYTGSPFTYSSITGISAPTNSGGTPTSYSISPALPSGLSFNTSTGAITGTQTVLSSATTYTVTATNAAGSTTATISITVSAIPPSAMSYSSSSFAFTRNTAITPIASPTNSGGTPTSYSINPALPAGLVLNTSSGAITGTPTVGSFATTYTVTASNTGGSTTTTFSITVNDASPSGLTYVGSPFIYTNGTAITPVAAPTNSGGTPISYSINPALPTGLVLNTATGAITGTPTAIQSATTHTITATNTGGSTTATISITVNQSAPSALTYTGSSFTFTRNTLITPIAAPTNGGGTPTSYAVSPALPSGLSFNTTTGAISGTPTVVVSVTSYTVTATNTVGSTTASISITVNDTAPTSLTYVGSPFTYYINTAITPIAAPTNSGGTPISYAVSPTLPSGLSLNTATGAITGTPTAIQTAATYTVTATNTGGSTTATINITVTPAETLDLIGLTSSSPRASGAYSLRKLRTNYTGNAVLVRRSSDDTTQAIGFDGSGNLDTTALVNFATNNGAVPTANAFVVTWYDQSGLDNHVTNATTAKQPQIVRNGSVITKSGKPVIYFPQDTGTFLRNTTAVVGVPNSMINVGGIDNLYYASVVMSHVGMSNGNATYIVNGSGIAGIKVGVVNIGTNSFATEKVLNIVSMVQPAGATATSIFLNGNEATITSGATASTATPSPGITIGARGDNGAFSGNSFISESIIFPSVLSTPNRSTIENNQYVYYLTPSISYPATNTVSLGTNNTISPTLLGGPITSFAISPSLPSGLSLNATTGVISGTPSAVSNGSYTVTATNTVGSATATFTIEVVDITLDQLGFNSSDAKATAAYSLRKLRTDYTGPAIRVRRSSDNTEQDIYFDPTGNLFYTPLMGFAGSSDVFVVTWYDQSGLGNHLTQTVTANQPRIVNAGVGEMLNGRPAVYFNNAYLTGNTSAFAYPNTINGVVGTNSSTPTGVLLAIGENDGPGIGLGNYVGVGSTDNNITGIKGSVAYMPTTSALTPNTTAVMTMNTLSGGSATVLKLNGTPLTITAGATAPTVAPTSKINIGSNASVGGPTIMINSYVQEAVFFNTTLSSTQLQTLESNQNVFYAAAPSAFSFTGPPPLTFTVGTAITPIAAIINSGGAPTSYSISPALPVGLFINTSSGAITGTPMVTSAATSYTVTATNGFGSTTAPLDIRVN